MKKLTVVGGGFSGLCTAYFALKKGFEVELIESSARLGGMLQTIATPHGIVESAANGLRNSQRVEELFADLGVAVEAASKISRQRYIFVDKPKRWPISIAKSVGILNSFLKYKFFTSHVLPERHETLAQWTSRVAGKDIAENLISPAFQGIYGVTADQLSAQLIWDSLELPSPKPKGVHGTVRSQGGMGQMVLAFQRWFEERNITIRLQTRFEPSQTLNHPTVLCLPVYQAAQFVPSLAKVKTQGLITVTGFFPAKEKRLEGYGVLFPRSQKFQALGVLFEQQIFTSDSTSHMERWIYAADDDRLKLDDHQMASVMAEDRERLYKTQGARPLSTHVIRWPQALPVYNFDLQSALSEIQLPKHLYLGGNYLGRIGLAKMLDQAEETVFKIEQQSR